MDNRTSETDVLIVGAGPTGLTLACELARRGIAHRIVDRLAGPNRSSRGKGIQPRSLEVLDDLGVAAGMLATGAVRLPVRLYDVDGGRADREPVTTPATVATPFPELLWIAEFDVERALRERLAQDGGRVEFGTVVTGLADTGDRVDVSLTGADGIRARWVVGADGGRSTVRKALGVPFDGVTRPTSYYLGDVRTLDLDRGRQHVWASPAGMLALTPLPGTDVWQFQCAVADPEAEHEPASLELYQRIVDDRAGTGRIRLTGATWLSLYRASVRLAGRYRTGRVLLAGDAAHTHSPAGGQGMNTGIQDAHNLGWKLAAVIGGADAAVLDTYETERRPVAAAVLADSSTRSARVRSGAGGDAATVAAAIHGITDDHTTGLLFGYPDSALSHDRAGRRAPHVTGLRGPGFAGSTFDLLRGPHWTALAFTDTPVTATRWDTGGIRLHRIGAGAITDPDGATRRAFGVDPDTLVLIRPDGHTALTTPLPSAAPPPDLLPLLTA